MTWRAVPLKRVASIRVSNVDKKSVEGEPTVRLCNYTDVYYRNSIDPTQEFMQATATPEQLAAFRLRTNDVIITKDSEAADDIGVPTYVEEGAPDLVCGYHLALIRPTRSAADGRFLFWAMASSFMRSQLETAATGITRFGLRADAIGGAKLDLPTLRAQRAIADFLDAETTRIDALIAKKRKVVRLLEARFRLVIDRVMDEVASAEAALGRFVLELSQGSSLQATGRPAEGDEWGVLKLSAVKFGRFDSQENKALEKQPDELPLVPRIGDLLVTRSNTPAYVGDVAAVTSAFPRRMLPDLIYRLRLDNTRMSSEFVAYALLTSRSRHRISALARGSSQSMVKLRGEDIRSLPVPVASSGDQERVVALLDERRQQTSKVVDKLDRQIGLLTEHRQALITAAVTGEIGVPGATTSV